MSAPLHDLRVHHIAMSVRDLARAKAFYCDLLGFQVDWDMDHRSGEALSKVVGLENTDTHIMMLKGHGLRLELFHYHHPQGNYLGTRRQCDFGLSHFALQVPDVDAIYQRLSAAGVAFNSPPQVMRAGAKAAYFQDPEGVTVELIQYD